MKEKDKWTQADIGDAQFLSNKYGIDYNLEPITLKKKWYKHNNNKV